MKIEGSVYYTKEEGGTWMILSKDHVRYLPINLPVQYQSEGCKVKIRATLLKDAASIYMNGNVIRITSFETL